MGWWTPGNSGGSGGGSVAADALWDAKGDIAVGSGANTATKLAIGSNHRTLVARSGESTGLVWADILPVAPYALTAGRYWSGVVVYTGVTTSAAWIADRVIAYPFWVPREISIDRVGLAVVTAVASSTLRPGLYIGDDVNNLPGTAIINPSGSLDTSATGFKEVTVSATIPSGVVWAVVQTGATATAVTRSHASVGLLPLGRASGSDVNPGLCLSTGRSSADLPSSLSGTSWTVETTTVPHGVQVRVA